MKLYLTLFFIFNFAGISAQNKKLTDPQTSRFDSLLIINDPTSQIITPDLRKINAHIISNTKNKGSVVKNITIVQEISEILNYKANRIWRKDLYCLVCTKNSKSGQIA